ncbi:amino acid permease family protein [Yersinia pseudotuberculosis IP 32953]|uniref:Aromatic amino acid transport protein AroP n=1 Tax=Yersinia pseudotuberculosis serotype I (strain IP32953) TaxID=273123 RepID=Q66EI2_YERPS|nr:amino acid permease [Yersinia pseudotuberculosis]CQD55216.1 aromatic amino acid transport protein [Yersinia intermedia]AJJ01283.1 amino acid permease family protein [Yersinia pseudotuberculosis]AJJ56548.1 amino acid permease family protein [Yersinia pseudotuberculosis IP 32953]AJJ66016.1 amino acid permease family protein [Yersinia pseudotuberculosis PB1/+]AJJ72279.1 amino acid permease family protein [Yersinia pseudotuberculosis]
MSDQQEGAELKRGLKNRHIQLIALGGAIGTGLFLGIAQTIKMAGPSVLLGYAIGGFIAFLIMRQLGEMVVEEPVAGSFSHFAYKYWGHFAGFASGWNYWVLYVLVAMAELTAVGIYVQYWWPEIPTWVSAAVFFLAINAINLANVKVYGEMEFWFAIIKVIAIIAMILFGGYLLISGRGGPEATVTNLWAQGGFFPNGIMGLVMAMAVIMFSFGGLELVGITAAEAEDPAKSIPKATNQVIYRILLFYIGSLAILLSLYPWGKVVEGGSPFVLIFDALDSNSVATVLNIVVLTAALSVYNSCVYCNSRMLFGLAKQGNGPKILLKVDGRGVPVIAIAVSAFATAFCVLINYLLPGRAFELLMALVVSALVINWAMISLAHLKFRAAKNRQGVIPKFKAFWYPFGNCLCLLFLTGILVIMFLTPSIRISVILIPVWVVVLAIGYILKNQSQRQNQQLSASSRKATK